MNLTRKQRRQRREDAKRRRALLSSTGRVLFAIVSVPALAFVLTFLSTMAISSRPGAPGRIGFARVVMIEPGSAQFWYIFAGWAVFFAILFPLLHWTAGRLLRRFRSSKAASE